MAHYNDKHMFAVWGGPGGGKTTIAVNMATLLAEEGFMTCLVSATDHGELQAFFGTAIPKNKGLLTALTSQHSVWDSLVEARPNLCILEPDISSDAYDVSNVTPAQFDSLLREIRDKFTYVIVDCTSHKESVFTGRGLVEADKVILCVQPRATASTWHTANSQMIEALGHKVVYAETAIRKGGCSMNQLLQSIRLDECPAKIPMVESAFYYENTSRPIITNSGRQEKAYKKSILSLIGLLLEMDAGKKVSAEDFKKMSPKEQKKAIRAAQKRAMAKKDLGGKGQQAPAQNTQQGHPIPPINVQPNQQGHPVTPSNVQQGQYVQPMGGPYQQTPPPMNGNYQAPPMYTPNDQQRKP